jgi:hypothetical protein
MKTQFTAGPWHTTGLNVRAGDALICYATNHWADDETPENERQANANLIAAAPELLAIVRALLPHANNEWTRLDDMAHRGNRESEDSAMELDRLIEHARETIEEITGDNE